MECLLQDSMKSQVALRLTRWKSCTGPRGSCNSAAYVKGPKQSCSVGKLRWESALLPLKPGPYWKQRPVLPLACLCTGHSHSRSSTEHSKTLRAKSASSITFQTGEVLGLNGAIRVVYGGCPGSHLLQNLKTRPEMDSSLLPKHVT